MITCIYCRGKDAVIESVIDTLVKVVCLNPTCGKAVIYSMGELKSILNKEKKTEIPMSE